MVRSEPEGEGEEVQIDRAASESASADGMVGSKSGMLGFLLMSRPTTH